MKATRILTVLGLTLGLVLALTFRSGHIIAQTTASSAGVSATASAARKPSGIVPVLGKDVNVRTGPKSWVVGTLFGTSNDHPSVNHKDSFDAQRGAIRGYVWGRAFGHINRCAYAEREYLTKENSPRHSADCGHPPNSQKENRAYLCRAFATITNNEPNFGTSVKTKRLTTLYANFNNNQPLDPIFRIPAGRNVGWRWVTQGHYNGDRYVMVNFIVRVRDDHSYYPADKSLWGFVKLADLENLPGKRPC